MKSKFKKIIPFSLYEFIWRCWHGHFSFHYWLLPIKKNRIAVISYYGKGYGDNPKYIIDHLLKSDDAEKYDIYWIVSKETYNKNVFPKGVKLVKYNTKMANIILSTSKVWIDNCRKNIYPPKRKSQFYIQTWHGSISLKQIERDAEKKLNRLYVNNAIRDSRMANLMISNSTFSKKLIKSSFWYTGPIIDGITPRAEILTNQDEKLIEKIKIKLQIDNSTKICLYAPTFRKNHTLDAYDIDFKKLLTNLGAISDSSWVILVRLHPNISSKKLFGEITLNNIIDVTSYDDMQELMLISDFLITDYSSTMFEFIHTNKPCLIYASDIENYNEERGTYFNLSDLPFPLAKNNSELSSIISKFDKKKYDEQVSFFCKEIGLVMQKSSLDQIIAIINSHTKILEEKDEI